jgi:endonuclease/exonuclease/phosphatase family metal-dependent hydrolase
MRIATWNLQFDRVFTLERRVAFRQSIAEVNADVWVLTETWTDFSPGDEFQLVAESKPAADLTLWPQRRWSAIWARSSFPTNQVEVHAQQDRMTCCRIHQSADSEVIAIGTVLPWRSDSLWRGDQGFSAALADQESEWKRLQVDRPASAFVVAGDFNQSLPLDQGRGSKKGEAAVRKASTKHGLSCLTQGIDALTGKARIDHIFVGRDRLTRTSIGEWPVPQINGKDISDHPGVFADVEFS